MRATRGSPGHRAADLCGGLLREAALFSATALFPVATPRPFGSLASNLPVSIRKVESNGADNHGRGLACLPERSAVFYSNIIAGGHRCWHWPLSSAISRISEVALRNVDVGPSYHSTLLNSLPSCIADAWYSPSSAAGRTKRSIVGRMAVTRSGRDHPLFATEYELCAELAPFGARLLTYSVHHHIIVPRSDLICSVGSPVRTHIPARPTSCASAHRTCTL